MSSETPEDKKRVEEALKDSAKLKELVEALSDGSRRGRQQAAKVIAGVAAENPEILVPFASDLVDALERSEAQTRWECLDALTYVVPFDSRPCDKATPAPRRPCSTRTAVLCVWPPCAFCASWVRRPRNARKKVWPLIDEGIQCYHGDLEFQDMLLAVIDFSQGKLDGSVKSALADRMRFDAENGKGMLKRRAAQIIENVA